MITANEGIKKLKEGNQRFINGMREGETTLDQIQQSGIVREQKPFAIILGCSDSRVPAEIVFDQGLGDLFVIRVAGNIVAPSQIGSVEFAVERFHTPLVVVLGHSGCGAVTATVEALENPLQEQSTHVLSIVNRVRPAVEPLLSTELRHNREKLLASAIRSNILIAVNQLRYSSQIIEQAVKKGDVSIVGAEYSLQTGIVEFLDNT